MFSSQALCWETKILVELHILCIISLTLANFVFPLKKIVEGKALHLSYRCIILSQPNLVWELVQEFIFGIKENVLSFPVLSWKALDLL